MSQRCNDVPTILVVDDRPENIDTLKEILSSDYKIKAATTGVKALTVARQQPLPDLILLDIMMPDMSGHEVIAALKANPLTARIPVIFVTAKNNVDDEHKGFELGAVDYITKPVSPPLVKARVKTHVSLYDQNRSLEEKVAERTNLLNKTRLEIIRRLGRAAEFKDNETGLHVIRMSHYCRLLAEALEMPEHWSQTLFEAAPMHDVGKIGIPDKVLLKPGKLDPDEWEIMKRHAEFGAEIIGDDESELLKMAKVIACTHHEKWNGQGYPSGLSGEDIPLEGRIVAIADVFDALTTARPYKKAWPIEQAVSLIEKEAGSHFDPKLVPVFISILPEILEIRAQFPELEEPRMQQTLKELENEPKAAVGWNKS